jgi:hypothetical protein
MSLPGGTNAKCRVVLKMSADREDRKSSAERKNDAFDPNADIGDGFRANAALSRLASQG